jgi:hypothetical protein
MKRVMATKRVMASATRVECNKEGNDGNKDGGQATATRAMATVPAMTWARATATRVAGNKEGNGDRGMSNRNGD